MTTKHTPTPWILDEERGKLMDADGEFVTHISLTRYVDERRDPEAEANAAFIVRAVNAHEKLVAALRTAHYYLHDMREPPNAGAGFAETLRAVDAALAKIRE
jgi:signal transduction histidine kinase